MLSFLTAVAMLLALGPVRAAASIAVVAAENFYGGVAQQIGTPHVAVTSILSNPDQDPHLFEVSPPYTPPVSWSTTASTTTPGWPGCRVPRQTTTARSS
jgi:ABC-type Zn uptake system ZnuABC Zn-binding protein ZnuA